MRFTGLDAISVEPYLDLIRPEVAFSDNKYGNGVLLAGCHSQTIIIEMRFTGINAISVEPNLNLIRPEVVFSDNKYGNGVLLAGCHLC